MHETMKSVMTNDLIRDKIMYMLTPRDAVNLTIATGFTPPRRDMDMYANIFRMMITDIRWLMTRVAEGYEFIACDPFLCKVMGDHSEIGSTSTIQPTLIVIKDGRTIPCTNEFMPASVFMNEPSPHCRLRRGLLRDEIQDGCRTITMSVDSARLGYSNTIIISTPVVCGNVRICSTKACTPGENPYMNRLVIMNKASIRTVVERVVDDEIKIKGETMTWTMTTSRGKIYVMKWNEYILM